jgi:hypothetical protein
VQLFFEIVLQVYEKKLLVSRFTSWFSFRVIGIRVNDFLFLFLYIEVLICYVYGSNKKLNKVE